jgi:hypothetical protein
LADLAEDLSDLAREASTLMEQIEIYLSDARSPDTTDYPTVIEVLAIHDDKIKRYGGATGVRDLGLLEAALFRPRSCC